VLFLLASLLTVPTPWVERAVSPPDGVLEAGVDVRATRNGFDDTFVGVDARVERGVTARLAVGGRFLFAPYGGDTVCDCSVFGGAVVHAQYAVTTGLALRAELGWVRSDESVFLPEGGPRYEDDLFLGLGAGASWKQRIGDRFAVTLDPGAHVQPGGSHSESDFGTNVSYRVPFAIHAQLAPMVVVRVETGIWGHKQLGNGGTVDYGIPAIAGATVTTAGGHLDVAIDAGIADVARPRETRPLYAGLSATWRTGP
jgi:hypothetical protein